MSETRTIESDLAHWKHLAQQNAERLRIQSEQMEASRQAADEARARTTKYKGRLENAQARIDELTVKLTTVSAERDALRSQVADQEIVKRKIWEFRQSILNGPLFELFGEYCRDVGPSMPADEGATL